MAPQPNPSGKEKDEKGKNIQAVARRRQGKLAGFRTPGFAASLLPARLEERDFVCNFLKEPDFPVSLFPAFALYFLEHC